MKHVVGFMEHPVSSFIIKLIQDELSTAKEGGRDVS